MGDDGKANRQRCSVQDGIPGLNGASWPGFCDKMKVATVYVVRST
jgi:hypothetical protein